MRTSRLHLFTSVYECNILRSDTKKLNFLVLVNDQLEKGIKIGQGGGEQKQKSHSDLKENDMHSKSAVILAFSSFYDFPPLFIAYFLVLLPKTVFFTLLSSSLDKSTGLGEKDQGRGNSYPDIYFFSDLDKVA